MVFDYPLVIAVSLAVLTVTGGIIAALRLIPRPDTPDSVHAVRGELADLQSQFLDFADRYELAMNRNTAKVGKLRRKLAKSEGDDLDDPEEYDEQPGVASLAPPVVVPLTKRELWQRANASRAAS